MSLKRRADGWWIVDVPDPPVTECGPYRTKAEADEDRRGLVRFFERLEKQAAKRR